jgi:hypothetical protein
MQVRMTSIKQLPSSKVLLVVFATSSVFLSLKPKLIVQFAGVSTLSHPADKVQTITDSYISAIFYDTL